MFTELPTVVKFEKVQCLSEKNGYINLFSFSLYANVSVMNIHYRTLITEALSLRD